MIREEPDYDGCRYEIEIDKVYELIQLSHNSREKVIHEVINRDDNLKLYFDIDIPYDIEEG